MRVKTTIGVRIFSILFLICASTAFAQELTYQKVRVKLTIEGEPDASADIRAPFTLAAQKYPAVIFLGWPGEGVQWLDQLHPSQPMILASFDYLADQVLKLDLVEALKHVHSHQIFLEHNTSAVRALVSVLRSRPDVDASAIVVIGSGLGSYIALSSASFGLQIGGLVLADGFSDLKLMVQEYATRQLKPRLGVLSEPLGWLVARYWILAFDITPPLKLAHDLGSSIKTLLLTHDTDSLVPPEVKEKLARTFRLSSAPLTETSLRGDASAASAATEMFTEIQRWMIKNSLMQAPVVASPNP